MLRSLLFYIFAFVPLVVWGQPHGQSEVSVDQRIEALQKQQEGLKQQVRQLCGSSQSMAAKLHAAQQEQAAMLQTLDSLRRVSAALQAKQENDCGQLDRQLQGVNATVATNQAVLDNRTLGVSVAVAVILLVLCVSIYCTLRRFKRGSTSIDELRRAQESLEAAHAKMQEETVKLDNKMVELIEKQLSAAPDPTEEAQPDHSLALKVADEIVRIELNLSRMDSAVKGYKQLSKAVQRIKDNFSANGYEIIDMLGKPYVQGMKVVASFVADENLEPGQQIITKIIKPQINYRQIMIQAAQIEVSQSE